MESLEVMRKKYVALGCDLAPESRLVSKFGSGFRIFFIAACNGEAVVAYDVAGNKVKGPRKSFVLRQVYNESGKPVRHEIDPDTGHLLLFAGIATESDTGEQYEQWHDKFPWEKYDPAFDKALKEATDGIVVEEEDDDVIDTIDDVTALEDP